MLISILFYYICIGLTIMAVACFIKAFFVAEHKEIYTEYPEYDPRMLLIVLLAAVLWPVTIVLWVYGFIVDTPKECKRNKITIKEVVIKNKV